MMAAIVVPARRDFANQATHATARTALFADETTAMAAPAIRPSPAVST